MAEVSKTYLLVVNYYSRATLLQNGYSPEQLLMGRRLRTTVPMLPALLNLAHPGAKTIARKENERRILDSKQFNMRHRARDLSKLLPGEEVWVTDAKASEYVVACHFTPLVNSTCEYTSTYCEAQLLPSNSLADSSGRQ
ncbi:hypothetical protein SRHO_G00336520 [Serrasalmus rhombeus]